MNAETKAKKMGVRLVTTTPIAQAFHFELRVGRRRVAAAIVYATTTAKAWSKALATFRSERWG